MVKIGLSVLKTGGVPILNWNTVAFLYDFQLNDTRIGYGKLFFSTSGNSEDVFKVDENSLNGQNQGI